MEKVTNPVTDTAVTGPDDAPEPSELRRRAYVLKAQGVKLGVLAERAGLCPEQLSMVLSGRRRQPERARHVLRTIEACEQEIG